MNDTQTKEQMQEAEYAFPYHHVPVLDGEKFEIARIMDWGTWGCAYTSYVRHIVRSILLHKCTSVLDVGCGDGRLLKELDHSGIHDLAGIDVSGRALHFAKGFVPRAEFRCGDVCQGLAFDRQFDTVTLVEVLEHLPPESLPQFIEAVVANIRSGGYLIVTVPSTNLALQPKHYQHFDANSLRRVLSPAVEVIECEYLNRMGVVNGILRRLLANDLFVLNNSRLLSCAYKAYEKWCAKADETDGCRVFALCRRRPDK